MTRYQDPGFDPRIADWLEADPSSAPADLIRVVEGALPSIPQRRALRLPWRFPTVNRLVLIAATVGLLALAGVGLLGVGSRPTAPVPTTPPAQPAPSNTPLPTPVPSGTVAPGAAHVVATDTSFTSARYGYRLPVSSAWIIDPATKDWSGIDNLDAMTDYFTIPGTDTSIGIAAQKLPKGMTFDEWLVPFWQASIPNVPEGCDGGNPATWPDVPVGGRVGKWQQKCNFAQVLVEVDGRVFLISWGNDTFDNSKHVSPTAFKELLTRMTFPGAAGASPSASARP